ncbi:hypothetical protein AVEN_101243-1 [Araneus ventricosus]|uniref:Uncharacterized protein n=1 Tax=Araneus ventricosus TaxID=182803 RepID=A0A4Y2Q8E5_ARAVE|nr:hypothetical protein AVEN_101243-1 [Araneus ventricosus]
MKIGVEEQRCWNSNKFGYPLEWKAIKMKYDPSRLAINHPCVWWESWGWGKCVGVAVRLEKSGRGRCFLQKQKSPVWGRVGGSQSGGRRSRWIARFGASVNDLPKSIDLNRRKNKPIFGPPGSNHS